MPLTLNITAERDYYLPEDRVEAHAAILAVLLSPGGTYIDAYGLSDGAYAEQIKLADANGVNISIACDRVQASGPSTKPILQSIVNSFATRGKSMVTITTAGPLSDKPGQIYHKKTMVSKAVDGGEDWCVEGSLNFTIPGISEANTLRVFRSNEWAAKEISDHINVIAWARAKHPEWQFKSPSL